MRLLSIVLFQLLFIASLAGQKKILVEKFTNAFCGQCAGATEILKELSEDNPDLIWVLHHKPVTWTDNELTNDDCAVLWDDLDKPGNPTGMINRIAVNEKLIYGMNQWEDEIERQKELPHYAQVAITNISFDRDSRNFDFDVEIIFDELPNTDRFSITAMMLEDKVETMQQHSYYNDVSGHPLEGRGDIIWDYQHSNVVRAILDAPWGTNQTIPPSPSIGEVYSQHYSYQVPESYAMENMKIVALVSNQDNDDVRNRAVFNSTQVNLNEYGFELSSSEELPAGPGFMMRPNPAAGTLHLSYDVAPDQVKLIDINGRVVWTSSDLESEFSIATDGYPRGLYFLQSRFEQALLTKRLSLK